MCPAVMRRTRVSESDLRTKLRKANVLTFSEVMSVVLETTVDTSVLHGPEMLLRVRDGD